jgi:hypothetical protein
LLIGNLYELTNNIGMRDLTKQLPYLSLVFGLTLDHFFPKFRIDIDDFEESNLVGSIQISEQLIHFFNISIEIFAFTSDIQLRISLRLIVK